MEIAAPIRHSFMLFFLTAFTSISCTSQNTTNSFKPTKETPREDKRSSDTSTHLAFKSLIYSIFEDSKGNFWFGSDLEGVCKYDGQSFSYFTKKDGLVHNQIRSIQEDLEGNIWFGTGDGVSKYDGKTFATQMDKYNLMPSAIPRGKWQKGPTDLWFNGEVERGVYRYDGQTFALLEFPTLVEDHESFSIKGTVTDICEGQNNRIWIANYRGVLGYDGEDFIYINERGIDYHIRSILEDSKENLWIGNNGIGVLRYDGNTTINFTVEQGVNDQNGQSGGIRSGSGTINHVFAIEEDNYGNIWFGDRDTGAWRYDGTTLKNYTIKNGLTSNFVRVIYADRKGNLWLGTDEGGICKFNGESFEKMY